MTIIKNTINTESVEFAENYQFMHELVNDLRKKTAKVSLGGSEKSRERHTSRENFWFGIVFMVCSTKARLFLSYQR